MFDWWMGHWVLTRWFLFLTFFFLLAYRETKSARRKQIRPPSQRWPQNLGLALTNLLVLRVVLPGSTLWACTWAAEQQMGLFHWVPVPGPFSAVFTLIVLDWILYYFHRTYHAVPWMWKIHRTHHTDLEVDVTTGLRFHPLEVILTLFLKSFFVVLIGPSMGSVIFFEVCFNAATLFSHSNLKMPGGWDRPLRWLWVTPDMHRVHHSSLPAETHSNFGLIFSWWDRLFGTYRAAPQEGQEQMRLGLEVFNEPPYQDYRNLLLQPFMDLKGKVSLKNLTQPD